MWLIDLSWEYQTHCHQQLNKESIALPHLQHHFCCTTATLQYKRVSAAFATLVSFVDISIAAFIHKIEKATLLIFGIMHSRNLISFALSSFQTISFLCTYIFHISIIISYFRYRVKNIGRSEQCPKHLRFEAMMVYSLFLEFSLNLYFRLCLFKLLLGPVWWLLPPPTLSAALCP